VAEEICFWSARRIAGAVRSREVSCREVVAAHLDQIERVNPAVNAVVTLVPERALEEARLADEATTVGRETGPLHGVPVAHKDTHATAGIRTTYGSRLLADHVPDADELVVERLRRAGVISIGKTNVPEFAAGSHTFNEVFGVTRNPYDLTRSAGGSSGGAAAALACGMQPLADGSDMGGSLRNPASFCNVVGFRPSAGRVPSYPSLLPWGTLGVQGPMARTVGDVALAMRVLAGPDPRAPLASGEDPALFDRPLERGPVRGPVRDLEPDPDPVMGLGLGRGLGLAGLRVAWSPDLGGSVPVEPEVVEALEAQLGVFADLGCPVEIACPDFTGADEAFRVLRAWQFGLTLGPHLREHRDVLKPGLVRNIEAGASLSGHDVAVAHQRQGELYHRVREFFEVFDVLLLPVSQVVPFDIDLEYPDVVAGEPQEDYLGWMRSASQVSLTGCPALSVPAGFTPAGLPVGLQVVGPHMADLFVLQVGAAFEARTRFARVRPGVVSA
jgi:amidase